MNQGLSPKLELAFPDIVSISRPNVKNKKIYSGWMRGFVSAEGCFMVFIQKPKSHLLKGNLQLGFLVSQHKRDEQLMINMIEYFQCGSVYKCRDTFEYRVTKFSEINEIIIPYFKKNPVLGIKSKDFSDFCKIAEMVEKKEHLTQEGFEQIQKIKAGMNTGRESDKNLC